MKCPGNALEAAKKVVRTLQGRGVPKQWKRRPLALTFAFCFLSRVGFTPPCSQFGSAGLQAAIVVVIRSTQMDGDSKQSAPDV